MFRGIVSQIQQALNQFERDREDNLDKALLPFADLKFLEKAMSAFLAGNMSNSPELRQYLRLVSAAELVLGDSVVAKEFRSGRYADPQKHVSALLGGGFASYIEAAALSVVLVRSGVVSPFDIEYSSDVRGGKQQFVSRMDVFSDPQFVLKIRNTWHGTHFVPASERWGSASANGNNCLYDSMLKELKGALAVKASSVSAARKVNNRVVKEVKQKEVVAKPKPMVVAPAVATAAADKPELPKAPVVPTVIVSEIPKAAVTALPVVSRIPVISNSISPVKRSSYPTAAPVAAAAKSSVRHPSKSYLPVATKPSALASQATLFASKVKPTDFVTDRRIVESLERMLADNSNSTEQARLFALMNGSLAQQERLAQIAIDRICAERLTKTGRFTSVNAFAVAKAFVSNNKASFARLQAHGVPTPTAATMIPVVEPAVPAAMRMRLAPAVFCP